MKNKFIKTFTAIIICSVFFLLFSCGKDQYLEKRSGPWKITNVEIAFYKNYSSTPDSVVTYSSDTTGYFNFYNGTPANVYVVIRYPSRFLIKDYEATYEVHEQNRSILVISNLVGSNWVDRKFTVTDYNKRKQEWTIMSDDFAGNVVRETISVEKQ
jgi:hypothetical protein